MFVKNAAWYPLTIDAFLFENFLFEIVGFILRKISGFLIYFDNYSHYSSITLSNLSDGLTRLPSRFLLFTSNSPNIHVKCYVYHNLDVLLECERAS